MKSLVERSGRRKSPRLTPPASLPPKGERNEIKGEWNKIKRKWSKAKKNSFFFSTALFTPNEIKKKGVEQSKKKQVRLKSPNPPPWGGMQKTKFCSGDWNGIKKLVRLWSPSFAHFFQWGEKKKYKGRRLWSEATAFPIGNGFTPIPPLRGGIRECSEAGGKRMAHQFFLFH